jgi:glycosyltransferase involved in cell wall biosynthesis
VRILQISSARAIGGGERHLAALACALSERGHEVHVALAPRSPLRAELSALPESRLVELPLRNALDVGSAHALARLVRRREIEIVHAHMARDYPLASYATRRSTAARLFITRHVLFPLNRLHSWTLKHVSRVIAVSRAVARSLEAQRIFPSEKISIVPNGIDVRYYDALGGGHEREAFRRRLGAGPENLLVGTVGELNRLKGHEEFLRAAHLLDRRFPDASFVIAGEDFSRTGEHRARLERLIAELRLEGRVRLTGWLEEVAPLLRALDLFVSASHTARAGCLSPSAMRRRWLRPSHACWKTPGCVSAWAAAPGLWRKSVSASNEWLRRPRRFTARLWTSAKLSELLRLASRTKNFSLVHYPFGRRRSLYK